MTDHHRAAFIFDMDGTLIDNMRFHARAWQAMLAENDVAMNADEFLVKTAGMTNREIIPGFFRTTSEHRIRELADRRQGGIGQAPSVQLQTRQLRQLFKLSRTGVGQAASNPVTEDSGASVQAEAAHTPRAKL